MISVHEVFTLLLGNNIDYASRDSDMQCAALPLPNKVAWILQPITSGYWHLVLFLTSISASLWKKTSFRDWSSASRHEIFRSDAFHNLLLLSLLLNIWSHSFNRQFRVSCILNLMKNSYWTYLSGFVLSGPLWQWSGRSFQNKRKGKGKKSFYKAIVRGDETICVSDSAFFRSFSYFFLIAGELSRWLYLLSFRVLLSSLTIGS